MYRTSYLMVTLATAFALVSCGGSSDDGNSSVGGNIVFGTDSKFEPTEWTGPFAVGSTALHLVDMNREEPHTDDPDDVRELMVRLFYPTNGSTVAERLPVINDRRWEFLGREQSIDKHRLRKSNYEDVTWPIELDVAPLPVTEGLPLLIFSHGYGFSAEQHVVITGELASRGYLVASISHTYGAWYSEFPDGRAIGSIDLPRDNLGADLQLWSDDQVFVLDELVRLNGEEGGTWFEFMDLHRVGAFGHSYGGAAAYHSASQDPRFAAAIDMDGTIFNSEGTSMSQPFMLLQSGLGDSYEIFDQVDHQGYAVAFENRIKHHSFADYVLFWAWDFPQEHPFGPMDSARALGLITDCVDQFFSKWFDGAEAPYLDDPSQTPSELRVDRFP